MGGGGEGGADSIISGGRRGRCPYVGVVELLAVIDCRNVECRKNTFLSYIALAI